MDVIVLRRQFSLALAIQVLLTLTACSRPSPQESKQTGGPPLSLYFNAEEQSTEKSAVSQVLQNQLASHGIKLTLDPVPSTIFNDRLGKGQFQSTLALWYLDYNDPEGFLTDFYSKSGFRMAKYNNPLYDEAYLAGLLAPTEAKKMEGFKRAVSILDRDLPWVPLYSNDEIFLLRPDAEGFRSNAYQYYDYRRVRLDEIRVASDVEVQTLDPAQAYDLASKHLVTQSYEGLIALDAESRIVPALATSWSFSENHDSLMFKLRSGVTFHSGKSELQARDVKASFERLIKSNSPYAYIFDYVKGVSEFKAGKTRDVSGFQVEDPRSFRIILVRPFPTMLPWLLAPAAYILPANLPSGYDFSRGSMGTGPFILRSWDGTAARFTANPNYWMRESGNQLPLAKGLSIRVLKDANATLSAFRKSELDILNVPLALFSEVLDAKGSVRPEWAGFRYREVRLNNLKFVAFNMQASPWGKGMGANLRRRISISIDRDAIVRQLFRGKARVAHSVVPSGISGFEQR